MNCSIEHWHLFGARADRPLRWDGLAAGVSLSPTSVGIALKLLMENQQLHKPFGQVPR